MHEYLTLDVSRRLINDDGVIGARKPSDAVGDGIPSSGTASKVGWLYKFPLPNRIRTQGKQVR